MEKIRSSRKQYRRLFTIACNEFYAVESDLSLEDKISKLKVIEGKSKLLVTCENEFREILLETEENEEVINKEIDESETYIDKWRVLENKLCDLLEQSKSNSVASDGNNSHNTLLHYPKIKLPTFDGNVKNWLGFWGQFQKIDKDCNLDNHDKFAYLSQAMEKGTSADELIKSFPPGGESYSKALKQLQTRYGREELLIQIYVRDLLSIVLLKQKSVKTSLRKLYDQLESKLRALETLGVTRDKYAAMLYPLVESSLPDETLRAWERFRSSHRRTKEEISDEENSDNRQKLTTDLDSLLSFLQDEVESEERIFLATQSFDQNLKIGHINNRPVPSVRRSQSRVPTATELLSSTQNNKRLCIFCSGDHKSWTCRRPRMMSLRERQTAVETSHCCFLCLKEGHGVKVCRSKLNCQLCGKRHNLLLCKNLSQEHTPLKHEERDEKQEISVQQDEALANLSKESNVLLQTLAVILRGSGVKRKVRAIIDTGSQKSYILKTTAVEMNYPSKGKEYLQHSLFGGSNTNVCHHDVFTIYLSSMFESYNCHFDALGQSVICETIAPIKCEPYLQELFDCDIHLTDDLDGPVEVLIGADVAGKLITGNCRQLKSGLTALETKLGWTVLGRVTNSDNTALLVTTMLSRSTCISDLWALDSLGITDPSERKTALELQEAAKEHFLNTVKVENDRFSVHLPWIEGHPTLGDNFELSLKRLNTVVKRLRAEGLYESYGEIFDEWLSENVIEEVPRDELQWSAHYLPHRPVLKEHSTTKIRPVFDASAKQNGSPSLNACLEKGINLIELIPNILYRFRMNKIGAVADIRKAFLQIKLSPSDKNFLRFLWIQKNGELKHFRHCRVVFGVSSSPFLLGVVIQYHLETVLEHHNEKCSVYPENIIRKLMNSFYVDNCVTSVSNEKELELFIKVATGVMAERKFDLRGWECTNFTSESTPDTNVLGILWDRDADTLRINTSSLKDLCVEKVTKKVILSAAHRIFDPIGVTCPVTLLPKLLLQNIWKMKLNWEEEVDLKTKTEFLKWLGKISHLEDVRIPRCFKGDDLIENCSLHFFCDASKHAYAVAVFIRIETAEAVKVKLVQARSRVSPTGKKETTIARLELLAATIASRLASTILCEISHDEVWFWSDSTTVLTWIKREECWGTFVQNRVTEIRTLTSKEKWRHVSGSINPADLPSRGCSAQKLLRLKWWEGPNWLHLPREMWPSSEDIIDEEEVNCERKKGITSSMINFEATKLLGSHLSDYKKIVHTVAWMKRFLYNCQNQIKRKGNLLVNEIEEAEKTLVYLIQQESFTGVSDKRLQSLDIFFDEKGILKLKTTVYKRDDYEEFRTPAILPGDHPIVKSLVLAEHKKKGHAGVTYTLNSLRERFWLLCGRRTVKSALRSCVVCKRFSAKPVQPPTTSPPADRVQDANIFQVTGVDFAGPVILKDNSKAWICLFTCAVYRALHLELVTSLSTETFLLCFHRFVARRGKPSIIYSDNGTNFTGAAKALSCIDFKKIRDKVRDEEIHWRFIVPSAPWWGGFYERLIGLMKDLLKKTLGRSSLTYEEMQTALCNCEAILNERPLTTVSSDSTLTALRPADFLKEIKNSFVPDLNTQPDPNYLRRRIRYLQTIREAFRVRFRQEYLGALCSRQKKKPFQPLKEGDIVLIGDDNKKRLLWPLGRVIEALPGTDGIVRRVRLKTQQGELFRAAQRLYHLEVSSNEDWSSTKHTKNDIPQNVKIGIPFETVKSVPGTTRSGRTVKIPNKLSL